MARTGGLFKTKKSKNPRQKAKLGPACKKAKNQFCQEQPIHQTRDLGGGGGGVTHAIICAIDYKCCSAPWGPAYPGGPGGIDTKFAFDDMHNLVDACGCQNVTSMFNE